MYEQRRTYGIKLMSECLTVTRSGYYRWISTGMINPKLLTETELLNRILEIFNHSKQRYGSPRITAELRANGLKVSKKRVARIMKKHGIKSKIKRRFKVTTNSRHKLPVANNLVEMKFNPEKSNSLWTSDITYIRTREGWLYLAVILDLWSRAVISWSADKYMDENLVIRTLDKAIATRVKNQPLIFHSDRGSQFASYRFRQMLNQNNIIQSMSSKGNCYDNAPTESFFSTLKREMVYRENFKTREEAKQKLFEYIEIFYNRKRRHSSLGYLSPLDFEKLNINLINHT